MGTNVELVQVKLKARLAQSAPERQMLVATKPQRLALTSCVTSTLTTQLPRPSPSTRIPPPARGSRLLLKLATPPRKMLPTRPTPQQLAVETAPNPTLTVKLAPRPSVTLQP